MSRLAARQSVPVTHAELLLAVSKGVQGRAEGIVIRPSRDEFWFRVAADYASMATCPRASIGCVIVNPTTKRQVGAGYNGAVAGQGHCSEIGCLMIPGADHCIRAKHAETNAADQVPPGSRNLVAYVVGGRDVCSHCASELYAVGVREIKARLAVLRLDDVLAEVVEWGRQAFPVSTDLTKTRHLLKEAQELDEHPNDAMEMADVLMILAHLAASKNVDLAWAVARKLAVCRTREWLPADPETGVIEHVREAV